MLKTKQKAVALTTAQKNNQHSKNYHNSSAQSRVKLQENLAEILLYLQTPLNQNQRKEYWVQFESKLRQYLELKFCGVLL